ncbi:MAG: replicative DNA helicase [Alphaproteobacteria bacterium]|nr:replicative DNA helicase [Alphaproteobacteria bacterium]
MDYSLEETVPKESKALERVVPSNVIAEQMLLGHILTDNENLNKVNDLLRGEHFFDPLHQKIYESIITFNDKGIIATPVTLKNYFDKDEAFKSKGGAQYLVELASLSTTIINIHDHAKVIFDLALKRELIGIGEEIVNNAFEANIDTSGQDQIEIAEQKLYNVANTSSDNSGGFVAIRNTLVETIAKAESAFKNKNKISGISTNFIDLDELLGGFQDSDLIILAGRPAMGKTAITTNLALNCCKTLAERSAKDNVEQKKFAVGLFSLEMSADQLASRMISTISGVSTTKIRTGHIDEEEFFSVLDASKKLQEMPLFIDDTPSLSISALRTRARRLKRKYNLSLLFIDYLQLIRANISGSRDYNRVQEISEITQSLKALAKELNIPVIALSQLSRAVEQREDKRPLLSDLRESGSIEQDADIVAFIYREEYYLMRKKPKEGTEAYSKWQQDMSNVSNITELIISKHRNGPVGEVKLYFEPSLTKFVNYTQNQYQ